MPGPDPNARFTPNRRLRLRSLVILSGLSFVLCLGPAHAADPATTFDWRAREYVTRDGEPLGCGIAFVAHQDRHWVRYELSVHRIDPAPVHETRLRVACGETERTDLLRETRVDVRGAWLRTPNASTVGTLAPDGAATSGGEYVATARRMEAFAEIFRGLRESGAVAGYRTGDDEIDRLVRPPPLPKKAVDDVIRCVSRMLEGS